MGWLSGLIDGLTGWWTGTRSRPGPGSGPGSPGPSAQFTTVDELLTRMRAVDAALDPRDGVHAFSRMYVRVTELVRERVTDGFFTNAAFMTRLDIVFAQLFLDAVAAATPTPAWGPVFELRRAPGRLPIQFALAGMNAHINNDLPLALVATCREFKLRPDDAAVVDDYRRVNDLLATVQEEVRQSFLDGIALEVDRDHIAPVSNLVGAWSIDRARDAAWTNAQVLWRLDGLEPLRTDFQATLSRSVGLAGRLLLTPVDELV